MKIISYNVNGIRSALTKNFLGWLSQQRADVVCLQETKANADQLDMYLFEVAGFKAYFFSAEKKGYSGVAILSKQKPDHVEIGMGIEKYDREGRVIRADYGDISIMSVYMPSGTSGDHRQEFKMEWLNDFQTYIDTLKKSRPNLIICGDFNICHQAIDIHNPIQNANSTGFLPEERAWVSSFLQSGFIDSFRYINKEPHQYTWWSFRANSRAKNKGWRIDYCMVSDTLEKRIEDAEIYPEAKHSDHCPTTVIIK